MKCLQQEELERRSDIHLQEPWLPIFHDGMDDVLNHKTFADFVLTEWGVTHMESLQVILLWEGKGWGNNVFK